MDQLPRVIRCKRNLKATTLKKHLPICKICDFRAGLLCRCDQSTGVPTTGEDATRPRRSNQWPLSQLLFRFFLGQGNLLLAQLVQPSVYGLPPRRLSSRLRRPYCPVCLPSSAVLLDRTSAWFAEEFVRRGRVASTQGSVVFFYGGVAAGAARRWTALTAAEQIDSRGERIRGFTVRFGLRCFLCGRWSSPLAYRTVFFFQIWPFDQTNHICSVFTKLLPKSGL